MTSLQYIMPVEQDGRGPAISSDGTYLHLCLINHATLVPRHDPTTTFRMTTVTDVEVRRHATGWSAASPSHIHDSNTVNNVGRPSDRSLILRVLYTPEDYNVVKIRFYISFLDLYFLYILWCITSRLFSKGSERDRYCNCLNSQM